MLVLESVFLIVVFLVALLTITVRQAEYFYGIILEEIWKSKVRL